MASLLEKYPYPTEFNVRDFVPDKLSDRSNYDEWKELMVDFIESRGLLGFIHGEVKAPPKTITIVKSDGGGDSDNGGGDTNSKEIEIENEEYKLWKRSDALVRGWILTTLTKCILKKVLPFKTAEQVWKQLEQLELKFEPAVRGASSIPSSMASSLEKYPYPSEFNVGDFVPDKLSDRNYKQWKELMVDFIESRGLLGFINGKVKAPPKTITVVKSDGGGDSDSSGGGDGDSDSGGSGDSDSGGGGDGDSDSDGGDSDSGGGGDGDSDSGGSGDFDSDGGGDSNSKEIENEEYKLWKRLDALVRGWILTTLTKYILTRVLSFKTAEEVWKRLEQIFDPAKGFEIAIGEERGIQLRRYQPLLKHAIKGDWDSASKFIEEYPDAVRAHITIVEETALHVGIRSVSVQKIHFVKKLVEKMEPQDLAITNTFGRTALHYAAEVGNVEATKLLVEKNPNLTYVWNGAGVTPLHFAAASGSREVALYLLDATRQHHDAELKTLKDKSSGAQLLCDLARGELYDIALTVVQWYPELACMEEPSPLMRIAETSSFRSRTPLNFWQKLIYKYVPMKLENTADHQRGGDIENHADGFISGLHFDHQRGGDIENHADCFISGFHFVKQRLHAMFWEVAEKIVPQMKHIREKKLIHHQALELVKFICMKVANSNFTTAASIFLPVLLKATSTGIPEIVEEILESFPSVVNSANPNDQSVFQFAIVCRRENVFNLIYQCDESSHFLLSRRDALRNNGLHLAGCLGPQQQLNLRKSATGAALQMQRELQWFKEVEKCVDRGERDAKNSDGMTPAEIFTDAHQELVKEGERWMKDTASSCTIVAALIATVVFAAAITVPGGNDNNSGHPIFSKQKALIIFGISDAFALFSSITSVLMFLSILTARYAEEDFLYALPKRLIIGLGTLFISILSTMIAFGATLYLVFGDNQSWILIPIVALACIPVYLFAALQFPLLVEMIKSTYGRSMFGKQSDRKLY